MKICTFLPQIEVSLNQGEIQTLSQGLIVLKKLGLDTVELCANSYAETSFNQIKNMLKEHELEVSSVFDVIDFNFRDQSSIQKEMEMIKRHLEMTVEIGSPYLMLVPIPPENMLLYEKNQFREEMTNILFKTAELAKNSGVTITIENFSKSTYPYSTIDEIIYFIENVPTVKYTFDCGNFIFCDVDAREAFDILKNHIVHIHLKDWSVDNSSKLIINNQGYDGEALGKGIISVSDIMQMIKDYKYDGALTIEINSSNNLFDKTKKSILFLKEWLKCSDMR